MPTPPPKPIPPDRMLGESDWEDQDLLTIDEANVRLDEEVRTHQALVAELEAQAVPERELTAARQRLAALTDAQRRVKGTRTSS